jgi:hypothetical protein
MHNVQLLGTLCEKESLRDAPCSAIGTLSCIALVIHAKEVPWQATIALLPLCTQQKRESNHGTSQVSFPQELRSQQQHINSANVQIAETYL